MTHYPTVNGVENRTLQQLAELFPNGATGMAVPPIAAPIPNGDNGAAARRGNRHRHETVKTVGTAGGGLPRATRAAPATHSPGRSRPSGAPSARW
jgi:hypothetical protein